LPHPRQPFLAYSQTRGLYLAIVLGVLGLIGTIYLGLTQYGIAAILTTPGLLFLAMIYGIFDYWRKPLRKAAFYDDHFEITGHEVNINSSYEKIENLDKVKNVTGSKKHSVVFTVQGTAQKFRIPYRATSTMPDLYSALVERMHAGRNPTIGELLLEREPRNDEEKTLLVAYYLDKFRSLRNFTVNDLENGFKESGGSIPRDLQGKIQWNLKKGFLFQTDDSAPVSYFITTSGRSQVEPRGARLARSRFFGSIGIYLVGILLTFVLFGYTISPASYFLILFWVIGGGTVLSWHLWHRRES